MTLCSLIGTKFPPPSSEQTSALSVQEVGLRNVSTNVKVCAALQVRMPQYETFVCTPLPSSVGLGDVACL